jgi:hypothetical protein
VSVEHRSSVSSTELIEDAAALRRATTRKEID